MPDVKEVYEMVTQQAPPEPDALERQRKRQRRHTMNRKLGGFAVAAAIVGLALFAYIVSRGESGKRVPASTDTEPSVTVPVVPKVDSVIDLNTGEMTPLPEAILRSLGRAAEGQDRWRQFHVESQYAVSSDGSLLAYVGAGDEGSLQIFTAGLDGTGVRQVTHDPKGATSPAWSPDGTKMAYLGYGGGEIRNLFVLDVATGESTQITDGTSDLWNGPQFTPGGTSLLYCAGPGFRPVLLTVPLTGGESTILFGRARGGMNDACGGSMSPDGSLVTMMGSEIGGPGAIRFVANADGTGLRHIPGGVSNPAGTWSPDGPGSSATS
jgi:Tol biopolymer transport system component